MIDNVSQGEIDAEARRGDTDSGAIGAPLLVIW
jgi:hypothetical protein